MQIEAPPTERTTPKPDGERRGLVIVHTGDGKGKSTAAFGLALRAHGRGKAVKIYQFMKVPSARFGEHRVFEQLGVPIEGLGDGFSWKSRDLEHSAQLARDGGCARKRPSVRVNTFSSCSMKSRTRCDTAGCRSSRCCRPCASGRRMCTSC
jgi:cob(I)alamin adenosyltransferase